MNSMYIISYYIQLASYVWKAVFIKATREFNVGLYVYRNYLQNEPYPLHYITAVIHSLTINRANRLLLIHGVNDENVFFKYKSQLVDCLVGMGKPYQL